MLLNILVSVCKGKMMMNGDVIMAREIVTVVLLPTCLRIYHDIFLIMLTFLQQERDNMNHFILPYLILP